MTSSVFCVHSKSAMRNPDLVRAPPATLDSSYQSGHLPTHQQQQQPYSGQTSPISTLQRPGAGQPPPPYNGDTSYDSGYDPYGTDVSALLNTSVDQTTSHVCAFL